ncbi:putative ankyrin repeat protein [Megavirus vitis]|nr:putative ankyrin repeat protein [Megavirus vitis]
MNYLSYQINQSKELPSYTKHYYEDKITANLGKKYQETQLYKYSEQCPENSELKKIMQYNLSEYYGDCNHYILISYGDLIKKGIISEIIDIIPKCESEELSIIAISCIEHHCYRILDELIKINMDFNSIIPMVIGFKPIHTLFSHIIERQDFEIIKYLEANEINMYNNIDALILALSSDNDDIFEYAQQFNFDTTDIIDRSFCIYFAKICNMKNINIKSITNRLQYFFDKGIDINEFYKNNGRILLKCNIDIFKIFINNGLILNDNMINEIFSVSYTDIINLDIANYLMELGYEPNNQAIIHVLENFNIDALQLLIKYNINLSDVTVSSSNELINGMVDNGLDHTTICHYLANVYVKKCSAENITYMNNYQYK